MNATNLHIPSNRVRDIKRYIFSELDGMYSAGELRSFANMLFEAYMGWDVAHLLLHSDDTVNQSDLLKFHWAVEDLKRYRPIQQVIGWTEFCGLHFKVTSDTLIPRPETAGLVSLVQEKIPPQIAAEGVKVLDLCTGSGCIVLALEHLIRCTMAVGVDVSDKALEVARENGRQQHSRAHFIHCDLLQEEPELPCEQWDAIVSNPPYILFSERSQMQPNVLDYEPEQALFVPNDDPLRFYRAIGEYAMRHLSCHGLLAFEINETMGRATCRLLEGIGYDAALFQDFQGRDRYVAATLHH